MKTITDSTYNWFLFKASLLFVLGALLFFPYYSRAENTSIIHVNLKLVQPTTQKKALKFVVSVDTKIDLTSCRIILKVPSNDIKQLKDVLLWKGNTQIGISLNRLYTVSNLPVGKYKFRAVFEIMSAREKRCLARYHRNLYVDVRKDTILSSNISFFHIKCLEDQKELEYKS